MLKMVDGTGIIGVDMVCPLGGTVSPPQPPNFDKVEMEGVGSLMLPNSLEAPVERVELIGNSVQPTTTGKNLFDESKAVTGRINPDNGELLPETSYISSDYIEVQEGETYFQSGSGDGYYRAFYDMNKKFTSIPTKGIFKITVPVGSKFLRISGRKERFGDWMIEKGDKATPYEPYTGLKSSPSPEYPQEIKSAGKWNEEKQKYEIDVKVTNSEQGWTEEQTLTLTSDRPITKWDKLVEQGGQYGWLYKHRIVTFNGGETWKIHSNNMAFYTEIADANFQNSFCDKYRHKLSAWAEQEYGIYSDNNYVQKYFRPPHEGFEMNVDIWKAFLNKNPLTVICESMSTEFVPLSESEQTQLRNLHSYNGTTNIMVDSGEVPCGIKLTYRKEI